MRELVNRVTREGFSLPCFQEVLKPQRIIQPSSLFTRWPKRKSNSWRFSYQGYLLSFLAFLSWE